MKSKLRGCLSYIYMCEKLKVNMSVFSLLNASKNRINNIKLDMMVCWHLVASQIASQIFLTCSHVENYCNCLLTTCSHLFGMIIIPGDSLVAQLVKNPPAMRETWVRSLGWEDLLEMGKATHSSILAWRIPWTV